MRDVLLLALIAGGCVYTLRQPWFGAILWTWVSVMNPHRQAYGFMHEFPVAMAVAVFALGAAAVTRQKRSPFVDPSVTMLAAFVIWICIMFPFSIHVDESQDMFTKVLKIDLMIFVSIAVLIEKKHIQWFIATMVFSLAFYGVKGGIFTVLKGGSERVWGPGGFIGGNNEIALALITIIPFMYYLYTIATKKWVRRGLMAATLLTAAAAIGSQSRGALLGIIAMAGFLWYRSDKKVPIGMAMMVFGIALVAFMPESWTERMHTIKTYDQDASALGRINAWIMCWNLSLDRPIGGGFAIYGPDMFALYSPNPEDIHAAHSIYFQILGEQGWPGLFLWMMIWVYTWRAAGWLRKAGKESPETNWCSVLGSMCQVSMIGFAAGGSFLSLAYFDLPYNVMVVVVCTKQWLVSQRERTARAVNPMSRLSPAG